MAYSELIKNFNHIRDYMREFYVYGFKSRDEYTKKSARSYDDERRRLASWLGDYMQFRQTAEGKNVFLSIDSRLTNHNPLYKAWKAKSFTDGDITLHFILLDILWKPEICLTVGEITEQIDAYLHTFPQPKIFDESTVRKKLKEYVTEGLLCSEKKGKVLYYHRAQDQAIPERDVLDYFSEAAPCGVIGSTLLDRTRDTEDHFAFKHHYITGTMDSEIMCQIFLAIREHRYVTLDRFNRRRESTVDSRFVPLKITSGTQSGRQYVMGYSGSYEKIVSFRLDGIFSARLEEVCENYEEYQQMLKDMKPHIWGVSTESRDGFCMEHVEFTIRYDEDEPYIPERLEREKRFGTVTYPEPHTCHFAIDVYDSSEMIPWIRTFICRIVDIQFSNPRLNDKFREDLLAMYAMYKLEEGGEENSIPEQKDRMLLQQKGGEPDAVQ